MTGDPVGVVGFDNYTRRIKIEDIGAINSLRYSRAFEPKQHEAPDTSKISICSGLILKIYVSGIWKERDISFLGP